MKQTDNQSLLSIFTSFLKDKHNITLAHLPNNILEINHKPALNILFEQVVNFMSLTG